MSDLVITKLSHCNAFCNGGQEMILLCEKVIYMFINQIANVKIHIFFYRLQRKTFKFDFMKKFLMTGGKDMENFNIRRYVIVIIKIIYLKY